MNPVISLILSNVYCKGCPIFENRECTDRIDARNRALELNRQYVPSSIKVLLVAESPPRVFIWDKRAYFYASGPERRNSIAYYVNQVLFKAESKEKFFEKFKECRFYLIDMVKCPLGNLPYEKRIQVIKHCARYLSDELHTLKFEKVVFIGKSTFKIIKNYLRVNFSYELLPLPFRSKRNVEDFKKGLAKIIAIDQKNS